MERLDVRRGRPQHQQAALPCDTGPGQLLGLIGQGLVLFERAVVFLVQDDTAQLGHGQEKRGTCPHHEAGLLPGGKAAKDLLTARRSLVTVVEKQGDMGQDAGGIPAQFAGQGHFRGQQEDALAPSCAVTDQLQIDGRLAAAGHAEQQDRGGPLRLQGGAQGLQRPLLVRRKGKGTGRGREQVIGGLIGIGVPQGHQAGMKQGTQGRSTARAQLPRQLTAADLSPFMQIFQNLALPYGLRPYRPGRIHPQQTHLLTGGIPARWQEPGLAPAQGRGQSPTQLRRQLSGLFHGAGKILVRSQPADTQPHLAQALRQDMPQHPPRLQSLPDGQDPVPGP